MTPAPDQEYRDRIRTDLTTNILVEAGAGSGKTTSLISRLVELVRRGTPVERIAAVTFTRKAANELREKFQLALEKASRDMEADPEARARCDRAVRELDRAFIGTIHSFCARMLRERPLEVPLDPRFEEVTEEDWADLKRRFWLRWLERAKRAGDRDLAALARVGVDPTVLEDGFSDVMNYPDVDFPLHETAAPGVEPCRRELDALLRSARRLMPAEEPADGWDKLMSLVRRLEFQRDVRGWSDVATFCAALEAIVPSSCAVVQKRWSDEKEGKAAAKQLAADWTAFVEGPAADLLRCWREHRYPLVMRVLRRAADEFAQERHATGRLGFEDLLLLTARLLREHPRVREELGTRHAHLLVDEFQDTDPVQAEICFLLASEPDQGSDWRTVVPRPGSLFVVGDPKQSIYRFRRADIEVYELVKARFEKVGAVLPLTANFRSVDSIGAFVNRHFRTVFPAKATPEQAPFSAMQTDHVPEGADGVHRYVVRPDGRAKGDILAADAGMLASWIAKRVDGGQCVPGDFLVLTYNKAHIEAYARALAERNVPVTTTGAKLPQEHELSELLVVLRAIADPENAVAVVAALEGLFFGLSPADLFDGSRAGLRFAITHPPSDETHVVGRALLRLHDWWKWAQRHPADVLLERILDDTGLLFHAAGQPLGDARAGALLHLVEALRASSTLGAGGIVDAMDRLEVLLAADAADAPLRPGRSDAVRVMNLHKAKGLEGEIVVLAAPTDRMTNTPRVHVVRGETGATGGICIGHRDGRQYVTIAQPPGWREMEETESQFAAAENARLLYVAATRARRELVIAQAERPLKDGTKPDESMWRPLAPSLVEDATVLELTEADPPGRRAVERSAESLGAAVQEAQARVGGACVEKVRIQTVTEQAKGDEPQQAYGRPRAPGLGAAWGRAVHRGLEALGRGRAGASLDAFLAAVARDEGLDDVAVARLQRLVAELSSSESWKRLAAGERRMVELPLMRATTEDGVTIVSEGVVDAAALGGDGWVIVDWKTDDVGDDEWVRRERAYRKQVESYAQILQALSARPASGRLQRVRG